MAGASLIAQLVKNSPAMQETWFNSWIGKICWRRDRLPTPVFLGFPCGSVGKESTCNVGELGSIPGSGRSLGGGNGYPLQYSCLENSKGQRSLVSYSPWNRKELDMPGETNTFTFFQLQNRKINYTSFSSLVRVHWTAGEVWT